MQVPLSRKCAKRLDTHLILNLFSVILLLFYWVCNVLVEVRMLVQSAGPHCKAEMGGEIVIVMTYSESRDEQS
jgi:hypothetical protein